MAGYLEGKVVVVIGPGNEAHRGVAVALAEAGADVAVAGVAKDIGAEAALHSISNEIWALNRRSTVATLAADDAPSFAEAVRGVMQQMGRADLVVRCDTVGMA
jgi:meso-butanediol dehydrogenase / (S,S)-butanediol dehydrogenase / diacetyl reductase